MKKMFASAQIEEGYSAEASSKSTDQLVAPGGAVDASGAPRGRGGRRGRGRGRNPARKRSRGAKGALRQRSRQWEGTTRAQPGSSSTKGRGGRDRGAPTKALAGRRSVLRGRRPHGAPNEPPPGHSSSRRTPARRNRGPAGLRPRGRGSAPEPAPAARTGGRAPSPRARDLRPSRCSLGVPCTETCPPAGSGAAGSGPPGPPQGLGA